MNYEYSVAELYFKFIADCEFENTEITGEFFSESANPDVKIFLNSGEVIPVGEKLFSDELKDVYKTENGTYRIIYNELFNYNLFVNWDSSNHFAFEEKEDGYYGTINKKCFDESKSMQIVWGEIDLSHIMLEHDRIILHGSYIIHDNKAIIFCGRSGIGKSTQADLWEKYRDAEIINGDKCIIYEKDRKLFASSLPMCGTSGICKNKIAQVGAVVFLGQSDKNEVLELSPAEKVGNLIKNSVYDVWRKADLIKTIDLCSVFFNKTKIVSYECRADKSAVEFLKEVIE